MDFNSQTVFFTTMASDDGQIDPVVGRFVVFGGPDVGRKNKRGGSERGLLEERSSVGHDEKLRWMVV